MRNGTAVTSLSSEHLQNLETLAGSERQKQERIVKVALGSVFSAGIDTALSSLASMFLAFLLFPRVQRRAQQELDAVIGRDRLPAFDDRPRLPYLEAVTKELLRWAMVTPLGLPHASTEDDVYKGHFIPKGTTMVANAWAVMHDPELYPDPEEFKPERFLDEDGNFKDDPKLSLAFGVGKRICPGRHFVEATLFITVSAFLAVFNVTNAKDENGQDIPIEAGMTVFSGVVVHPDKFKCSIVPRDKVARHVILANSQS